jgi:hypothetical protein
MPGSVIPSGEVTVTVSAVRAVDAGRGFCGDGFGCAGAVVGGVAGGTGAGVCAAAGTASKLSKSTMRIRAI